MEFERPIMAVRPTRVEITRVEDTADRPPAVANITAVPPYAVYVSSHTADSRLTPVEEPYPSWFYFTEDVLLSIALGTLSNPLQLQRIHIPHPSNDYLPPPPYDHPFNEMWD